MSSWYDGEISRNEGGDRFAPEVERGEDVPMPLGREIGSKVISHNGSALIGNDAGSMISLDGATIVAAGGGNLVAAGGGNYRLLNFTGTLQNIGGGLALFRKR